MGAVTVGICVAAILVVSTAVSGGAEAPLVTDRPDFAEISSAVGAGVL